MPRERRYPSDLTDRQWQLIESLLPEPPSGPAGRPPKHSKREVVNAILYLNRAGCSWRMLAKDFPPWQTVYWYFVRWLNDGTWRRVNDQLRRELRVMKGRDAEPSAASIDSQSVKTTEKGGHGASTEPN